MSENSARPSENSNVTVLDTGANAASGAGKPRKKRSLKRPLLFALLPVALVVGGYYYVEGGQIMATDNAYLAADILGVSTDVAGTVASIDVHENEEVTKGQVLFTLKQDSFRIALDGAKAKLGAARNQLLNLQASYKQMLAQIAQTEADIPYYETVLERQQRLISGSAATQGAYDDAKHNLDAAREKVAVAKAQAAATLAELGGNIDQPIEENPVYLEAKAAVDDAQRQLDNTVVKAPYAGVVTNVSALQVGRYLDAAEQGFSLVSTHNMWIAANPKETELTYIKPGQPVSITVDTYPDVTWKGTVASVSPASGASFALLPAQNTSGNWVKVVQRIPMRVTIDDADAQGKPPLRAGMSTVIEVDTGHKRGLPQFAQKLFNMPTAQAHE
ncbi:HlyD family secretion protein [Neorhizobium alkalisoli]|uniref:Membrane fusion protein (Multidrug efflux system) n=1 Tax=Neorhizobium alkalisoli TaxID=528178 RepID=A0A561QX47_9HYPH|nr:HlyD family secretion protein [Neorhizobium alkalisoli]TWF54938.1 membrane fusion protein (multidrug efflux system) [Neorhizobium alkalisoli]